MTASTRRSAAPQIADGTSFAPSQSHRQRPPRDFRRASLETMVSIFPSPKGEEDESKVESPRLESPRSVERARSRLRSALMRSASTSDPPAPVAEGDEEGGEPRRRPSEMFLFV